jgi:outer membrane protein assembly factor BamB
MKKTPIFIAFVMVCLVCITAAAETAKLDSAAPSWSKWRGPYGNGTLAETAWNPKAIGTVKPLWQVKVGQGYSSICVAGGYLFTVGQKTPQEETLVCLKAENGKQVWSFTYPANYIEYQGSRAMPVLENGRLYIMSLLGRAFCLDAATGKTIWDTDIAGKTGASKPQWAFTSSALIEGNLAVFNICKSGVALNKETGAIVWKSGTTAAGYATPVPFDFQGKRYLAVFGSKTLTVVEASTGKEFASAPWETAYDVNAGDPVIVEDRIFVATNYGTGCALFKLGNKSLTKVWENERVLCHFSSAVYLDGCYYCSGASVGGYGGPFFCLNAKDGRVMWQEDLGVASVMAVGKKLLITTETGDLIAAEATPKAFTQIARAERIVPRLCWTAPVFAGGRIYLRSDKGDLICLDVS